MLSAYVNALDMDGAEKFFRRLTQDGLSPNEVTYGALIKGYAKANDLEKMMAKYEEMRSSGIRANQTVLTTIMDAYGKIKDFDSAVIWYKEMESSGVAPDKKAMNVLLSLAKSSEELQEANMLVGNKDWQAGVPQSNAKLMAFTYNKDVDEDDDDGADEEDDDDYDDDSADDDDENDSAFGGNADEAFSIGVERADETDLGLAGLSYVH